MSTNPTHEPLLQVSRETPLPPPLDSSEEPEIVDLVEEDEPATASHALANAGPGNSLDQGAAQLAHSDCVEVKDLGWNEQPDNVPSPLVGGLRNEELWTLIRRFNKQMYHVKAIPERPIGNLDLNIADEEEFSPDKLRANLERLYMTVIVGLVQFAKHIARLRSWRESQRTIAFASVYFMAWAFDLLVPTILSFVIVLIIYEPSREYCFPPAPVALIDAQTGLVKKPPAGVLGSDDSLTGAPEKFEGEAVEQEASNFVNGFASIALSSATGKHPQGDPHAHEKEKGGVSESGFGFDGSTIDLDPTKVALTAAEAKDKTAGASPDKTHDKTKEPVTHAMWSKTRPVMHAIADISDGWERFANALSATSPFPRQSPRFRLAAAIVPFLLVSLFTSSYMFMKVNGFLLGFAFFGDPLIWRGLSYLNQKFPNWQKLLEIRNTLLKGVPTNAQLTLTLLRIGEANKAPLPPPPYSASPPPMEAHEAAGQNLDHLGVPVTEMAEAVHPIDDSLNIDKSQSTKKSKGHRILGFLKSTAKGGVETMLGTDRLKAAAGAEHAKNRIGVVKWKAEQPGGPVQFPARYRGKKGHCYITAEATSPALSWTTARDDVDPVFSIAISDIQEIKKVGGLGWKTKIVVGWATSREIADGILITDKEGDQKQLTAIILREELFNRLIAMGNHMWEAW